MDRRIDRETDRQTAETTKVVFDFRDNVNAPENLKFCCYIFSFKKYSHILTLLHLTSLNGAERLLGRLSNSCFVNP